MKKWDINISEGIGDIKLGMSRKDIELLLGTADDIDEDFEDGLITYYYTDLDLTLIFAEEDDYSLVSISTMHEDCTIDGKEIMYMDKNEVLKIMEEKGYSLSHEEDISNSDFPDLKAIEYNECGMSIVFDHDTVFEVHVSFAE